jgi:ribosomal protein S18 acetylase RimI-like enzyme
VELNSANDIEIVHTTREDLDTVFLLFKQVTLVQAKDGYKVWSSVDKEILERDVENRRQYKIVKGDDILCLFSVLSSDRFIWRDRENGDAIYLHRIVANPDFKGQKQFQKVLAWAIQYAQRNDIKFIRMDTWADNEKLIGYYKSFGFEFIENYKTPDIPELPRQNRNLDHALLELKVIN